MRSRRLLTVLLAALNLVSAGPASLFAQTGLAMYTTVQKEIIYSENFDQVVSNWPIPQARLENGWLMVSDRLNMRTPKTAITLLIDEKLDYEIEFNASSTSSVLPGQVHWNKYIWEFTAGLGTALYLNGSHVKSLVQQVEKNSFHKYTIRRSGSTFYYFIDGKNSGSSAYLRPEEPGKIVIGFSGKINVDDIQVSYIQKSDGMAIMQETEDRLKKEPETPPAKNEIRQGGKYYALIIGVSKYNDERLYLEKPEKDALQVKDILTRRYLFTDSTTFLLLSPTRQKVIAELYRLRKIIGPSDNLLIFYAGHGYWDKDARQGYWWAKDASRDDPSSWLSNSDLREQIRSIRSGHTLLISDACFSGGIFRTRGVGDLDGASKDIQMLYKMPSRRAMTSGTMTVVPDNSIFLEYFLKRLKDNQTRFLSSQQLFDSLRAAVINNSNVVPQDGVIAETGDEGGDFIFILKK